MLCKHQARDMSDLSYLTLCIYSSAHLHRTSVLDIKAERDA